MEQKNFTKNLKTCAGTICYKDGSAVRMTDRLASEYYLDVYVNDEFSSQLLCTPEYLTELTVGHLITAGVIKSYGDIEEIDVNPAAKQSKVILNKEVPKRDIIKQAVTPPVWKPEWLFSMANDVIHETSLYKITKGTHGCAIGVNGKTLFRCDDLGRHNAIDKAVGYAAMRQISPESCMLLSTGRISTDMVKKVLFSGIPVFATLKTPTGEAVTMAEQYHLTMLCKVNTEQFVIYGSGD